MKEFYQKNMDEILEELGATEHGFTTEQATKILEEKGENVESDSTKVN